MAIDYPDYAVLVIDNGSTDGSLDMIKENYSKVEILALDKNYGFAGGYNRCFTQLKKESSEFIPGGGKIDTGLPYSRSTCSPARRMVAVAARIFGIRPYF